MTRGAMAQQQSQAASLHSNSNELIKCIEELCVKRDELHCQILQGEEEKQRIEHELRVLSERLEEIKDRTAKKIVMRAEYQRAISETEEAYTRILESSQALLHMLRKEISELLAKEERALKEHKSFAC